MGDHPGGEAVTTAESPQQKQGEWAGFEVQGWEDQGYFWFGLR